MSNGSGLQTLQLVFDDGPSNPEQYGNRATSHLLDTLRHGVICHGVDAQPDIHAYYFVVGHYEEINTGLEAFPGAPALIERMLEAGHVLGNHTWSHRQPFYTFSFSQMVEEFGRIHQEILAQFAYRMRYYRAPGESRDDDHHPIEWELVDQAAKTVDPGYERLSEPSGRVIYTLDDRGGWSDADLLTEALHAYRNAGSASMYLCSHDYAASDWFVRQLINQIDNLGITIQDAVA